MFPLTLAKTPSEGEEEEEEEGENKMDSGKDEDDDEEEEEEEEVVYEERRKQKITIRVVSGGGTRRASSSSSSTATTTATSLSCCQADECGADLRMARRYNRRHKVCERHAKAPVVLVSGTRQRFCQQCSKFHELAMFDDTRRSCRERLASHNERRRKAHADQHAGSSEQQPQGQLK